MPSGQSTLDSRMGDEIVLFPEQEPRPAFTRETGGWQRGSGRPAILSSDPRTKGELVHHQRRLIMTKNKELQLTESPSPSASTQTYSETIYMPGPSGGTVHNYQIYQEHKQLQDIPLQEINKAEEPEVEEAEEPPVLPKKDKAKSSKK